MGGFPPNRSNRRQQRSVSKVGIPLGRAWVFVPQNGPNRVYVNLGADHLARCAVAKIAQMDVGELCRLSGALPAPL